MGESPELTGSGVDSARWARMGATSRGGRWIEAACISGWHRVTGPVTEMAATGSCSGGRPGRLGKTSQALTSASSEGVPCQGRLLKSLTRRMVSIPPRAE